MGAEVSSQNSEGIAKVLEDNTVVENLGRHYRSLSPKSRQRIQAIINVQPSIEKGRKTKRKKGFNRRWRPIINAQNTDISLRDDAVYLQWKNNPSSLGQVQGFDLQLRKGEKYQATRMYVGIRELEARRTSYRVVWRFFTLLIVDLLLHIGHGPNLTQDSLQQLADIICNSDNFLESRDLVVQNLKKWKEIGTRYQKIADSLGGRGSLFLLPQNVTENVWEHELPLTGDERDKCLQHLIKIGIGEEISRIGSNEVAERFKDSMLKTLLHHDESASQRRSLESTEQPQTTPNVRPGRGLHSLLPTVGQQNLQQYVVEPQAQLSFCAASNIISAGPQLDSSSEGMNSDSICQPPYFSSAIGRSNVENIPDTMQEQFETLQQSCASDPNNSSSFQRHTDTLNNQILPSLQSNSNDSVLGTWCPPPLAPFQSNADNRELNLRPTESRAPYQSDTDDRVLNTWCQQSSAPFQSDFDSVLGMWYMSSLAPL